jgi:hypothetical protein
MSLVSPVTRSTQHVASKLKTNPPLRLYHRLQYSRLRWCAERFGNREKRKNKVPTQRAVSVRVNPTSKHPLRTAKLFYHNLEILKS